MAAANSTECLDDLVTYVVPISGIDSYQKKWEHMVGFQRCYTGQQREPQLIHKCLAFR